MVNIKIPKTWSVGNNGLMNSKGCKSPLNKILKKYKVMTNIKLVSDQSTLL